MSRRLSASLKVKVIDRSPRIILLRAIPPRLFRTKWRSDCWKHFRTSCSSVLSRDTRFVFPNLLFTLMDQRPCQYFERTIVRDVFRQIFERKYSQWMGYLLILLRVKLRGGYGKDHVYKDRDEKRMRQTFRRSRCASATYSLNRW